MKTIQLLAIVLISTSLITSCGNKDEKKEGASDEKSESSETTETSSGTKLEGTWEIKRATGSMSDSNIGVTYEFSGNKLTFGSGSFKNPGTTEVTDNTFSFQAEGNDLQFMYDYEMNGDTLIVKMQNSDQTFYMVKQ